MTRLFLCLVTLLLVSQPVQADDLALTPWVRLYKSPERENDIPPRAYFVIYVENLTQSEIVVPTAGFDSTSQRDGHQITWHLFFPFDEKHNGKRVVRSVTELKLVRLKPGEVAKIEFDKLWPCDEEGEYKMKLVFRIKKEDAIPYGLWYGKTEVECHAKMHVVGPDEYDPRIRRN